MRLPLLGQHQRINAALALATVRAISDQIPVGVDAVRTGLASVNWPGRLQLVREPSGREILLDGAHNLAGARMLAAALQQYFPARKPALIPDILSRIAVDCISLRPGSNRDIVPKFMRSSRPTRNL